MSLLAVVVVVAPFLASPSLGSMGTNRCSAGWELVEGTCFRASTKKWPWEEARDFCREQGGDLATISSEAQQKGVAAILDDSVWIGYSDKHEDHFVWADGSDATYTSWSKGEPNNFRTPGKSGEGEDCVEMNTFANYHWNDDDCSKTKRFLCSTPARRPPKCEAGWARYRSSCYKVSKGKASWWDAERKCNNMGAYPATITSQGEHDFVKGLLHHDTWIGLHKPDGQDDFIWVTGHPLVYTNWNPAEPNNFYGWNEDCAEMSYYFDYNWNDRPCDVKLAYVCEKPPH